MKFTLCVIQIIYYIFTIFDRLLIVDIELYQHDFYAWQLSDKNLQMLYFKFIMLIYK